MHTPKVVAALEGERVVGVSAGWTHSLFVTVGGKVYSCGYNDFGALGTGDQDHRNTPTLVTADGMGRVVYVAAGDGEETGGGFSFAIDASGKIFSWGCQQHGQLGNGVGEEPRDGGGERNDAAASVLPRALLDLAGL